VIGVNFIDLLALLIVVVAVYFGWRSGFVVQALALVGFVVGIAIVVIVAPAAANALDQPPGSGSAASSPGSGSPSG